MDLKTITEIMKFEKFNNDKKKNEKYYNEYELVNTYLKKYGYDFKSRELNCIKHFVELIEKSTNSNIYKITDGFFMNYKLSKIGKEFDLLRLGTNYNVCIELKFENTTIEEQKQQLITDKFYLDVLGKTVYISLECKANRFIRLLSNGKHRTISVNDVISLLEKQNIKESTKEELDKLLSFNNFIISPFNNTDRFLEDKYFLTQHQLEIKNAIINKNIRFHLIEGGPGTGKSLLIYHIVKLLMQQGKNCLVVHSGNLNDGHFTLKQYGYNIIPASKVEENLEKNDSYDYIFVDEGQRLYEKQFYKILEQTNSVIIYSMDKKQVLSKYEKTGEIVCDYCQKEKKKSNAINYELKTSFRYENNIYEFIDLLDSHKINVKDKINNSNKSIELLYFPSKKSAKEYLFNISEDWKITDYTRSLYQKELTTIPKFEGSTSHDLIGQEFENVVVMLDTNFAYFEEHGYLNLCCTNTYYSLDKMLYQNLTRTKNRLKLVIIDNPELFINIAEILTEF